MDTNFEPLNAVTAENLDDFFLQPVPEWLKIDPLIDLDNLIKVQDALESIASAFGLDSSMVQIRIMHPL